MLLIFAVSLPQRSCVRSVADRTKYCSASDSNRNQKRCFMGDSRGISQPKDAHPWATKETGPR